VLEFLEGVINRIEEKNSTLGFEILNEPMIFRQADFGKVGIYHDYFIKHISALTDKTLFFVLHPQIHLTHLMSHGSKQKLSHQIMLLTK
jgi:hypothetical protein